eukprot:2783134-Rhodomonas_salina.7
MGSLFAFPPCLPPPPEEESLNKPRFHLSPGMKVQKLFDISTCNESYAFPCQKVVVSCVGFRGACVGLSYSAVWC